MESRPRRDVRKLWIEGPAGRLEAALRVACPARAAAVLAHPHPQHGGTLHNPVVFHADRELHRAGLTTLRFNFRGVGTSEGAYDDGRGEVEDIGAAVAWLRGVERNVPLLLVGYSFGAWCGIRFALREAKVRGAIAIGLPLIHFDFEALAGFDRPLAVIQGGADEFGPPDAVAAWLERISPPGRLHVIDGAPHLFPGRASEVAERVVEAADVMLALL